MIPQPHSGRSRFNVGLQHAWRDVMEALSPQTCYKSKLDVTIQRRYKVAPAHWRSSVPFYSFRNVPVATLHLPQSHWFSWLCACWNATRQGHSKLPPLSLFGSNILNPGSSGSGRTCLEILCILSAYPHPAWAQIFLVSIGKHVLQPSQSFYC